MSDFSIGNSAKSINYGGKATTISKVIGSHRFKSAVSRQQNNYEHQCRSEKQPNASEKDIIKEIKAVLIRLRNLVDQLLSSVALPDGAGAPPWTPDCQSNPKPIQVVAMPVSFNPLSPSDPIDPAGPAQTVEPIDPAGPQGPVKPMDDGQISGPVSPIKPEAPAKPALNTPQLPTTDVSPANQNLADKAFVRIGPSGYDDDGLAGADRPNPREISNAVAAQNGERTFAANGASALLWSWGQFVDHDVNLTKEGHEKADIAVPTGDRLFDPKGTGTQTINFERSDFITGPDGTRQQINEQTPFVDASMIYGATPEMTRSLRSFEGGKMLVSEGNHLPVDAEGEILVGDKRAGEQPGLTALHTLFVREHNRMADYIASQNPEWTDNQVFEAAKRYVTMEVQAITYNEFLPTLLGDYAPESLEYVAGTDGRMSTEFASAGFRLGHTMVNESVMVRNEDGTSREIPLRELFFSPNFLQDNGLGSVLGGMAGQTAEAVDPMVVDSLRNALFGPPGSGGLDLAALNIQRGRDHGLPSYNDMRESMGLPRIESFNDPIFQGAFGAKMASVYDSPDDIDLWVGALAEDQIGNSMLGQTMTYIVAGQFAASAAADPNFYTNQATYSEMAALSTLTLADVIRWNSTNSAIDDTAFIATDNQNAYV